MTLLYSNRVVLKLLRGMKQLNITTRNSLLLMLTATNNFQLSNSQSSVWINFKCLLQTALGAIKGQFYRVILPNVVEDCFVNIFKVFSERVGGRIKEYAFKNIDHP